MGVSDGFEPPTRSTEKPLRLCISNVYKGVTGNVTIEGKVESGSIESGDKVLVMPNGECAQVKSKALFPRFKAIIFLET